MVAERVRAQTRAAEAGKGPLNGLGGGPDRDACGTGRESASAITPTTRRGPRSAITGRTVETVEIAVRPGAGPEDGSTSEAADEPAANTRPRAGPAASAAPARRAAMRGRASIALPSPPAGRAADRAAAAASSNHVATPATPITPKAAPASNAAASPSSMAPKPRPAGIAVPAATTRSEGRPGRSAARAMHTTSQAADAMTISAATRPTVEPMEAKRNAKPPTEGRISAR